MNKKPLTTSIVINTLNRAENLNQVLNSLQWQKNHFDFEVVVVNGPSTD
ncbi:MAG: glycosyltransferase, partial [Proteobacteria bacterium]|nr:glycosyltransferase [Pseudomonadota bacterium]